MKKYIKLKYILLENFKNPCSLKKEWHTHYIQEEYLTSLGCVLNYSYLMPSHACFMLINITMQN